MKQIVFTFFAILITSSHVLAQAEERKPLIKWSFTEKALDINNDGIPSLWTYDPASVSSPEEAVEAVAKQLNQGIDLEDERAKSAFTSLKTSVNAAGTIHTRYQQMGPGGYPVLGAQLNLHEQTDASLSANGYVLPTSKLSSNVDLGINADGARILAEAWIPAKNYREAEDLAPTEAYWVPRNLDFKTGDYVLTQRVDVYSTEPLQRYYIYVGANSGEIVAMQNRIHTDEVVGTAETKYSGTQSFTTDSVDVGLYRLYQEQTRNCIIHTRNYETGQGPNFTEFFDDDNNWVGTNANQDEVARDAHWGGERYHDLLSEYFGWNSIDDSGFDMIMNVHHSVDYANAFWDGESSNYGDGEPGSRIPVPLIAIDIVAHEFTHGLTEFSAGLIYSDDSGGLNESFSDIYGVATRFFARPDEIGNWAIGNEVERDGLGIRNMKDPNLFDDPGTYQGDFWVQGAGVHTNSGVQNHWYQILTQGDTATNELGVAYSVAGIGWEDALRVAHETLTNYLTPSNTYPEAAAFSVEAATLLFGPCDDRTAQVAEAWKAVGLEVPTLAQGVSFSVSTPFVCDETAPITFTGLSGGAVNWDFGDGTTGTGRIIDHVFAPGTYDVRMYGEDCFGIADSAFTTAAVTVNPFSYACDTFLLPQTQSETIVACGGTAYDPQGLSNYENDLNSSLTVLAPNGATDGFTLTVQEFAVEAGYDFLTIYNLENGVRNLIDQYSGSQLTVGQQLQTTGEGFVLEFTSDGSVTPGGFRILFESNGGGVAAEAGFNLAQTTNTVYAPFYFEGTASGGGVLYDFGDGNAMTAGATDQVEHRYAAPGTYTVSQIAISCALRDTSTQQVVVTEGSDLCASIDSTYITLNLGDSTSFTVSLENCGALPLLLEPIARDLSVDRTSSLSYSTSNQTEHRFTALPSNNFQTLSLQVSIVGDFDNQTEFISVALDGRTPIDYPNDGNLSNGTLMTLDIPISPMDQAILFADGELVVSVINSQEVAPNTVQSEQHIVRLTIKAASRTNVLFDGAVPLAAGADVTAEILVNSIGRTAGVFRYAEEVQTNDVNLPDGKVSFPIVLTVVGQPAGNLLPGTIDLGDVYINRPVAGVSDILSFGSDALELTTISTSGVGLTHNLTAGTLIPTNESLQVQVEKAPATAGTFSDELLIETNGTNLTLSVIGNAIAAGLLELSENELRDTLIVGGSLTRSFTARNIGVADLNVTSARGTGAWISHTSTNQDLSPSTEVVITYTLDATGLAVGNYNSAMVMRSSDPEFRVVPIPVFLTVLGPPAASIDVPSENCGAEVTFVSTTNESLVSETWDFGDGNTSADSSPTHTYTDGGEFTITYVACNEVGCDTVSQLITVDLDCSSIVFGTDNVFTSSACFGELTDSGGPNGDYGDNEASSLLITVDAGTKIKLVPQFFDTEERFDYVEVFDGNDVGSPLLARWDGERTASDSVRSTDNAMFIRWSSDASVVSAGFELIWTCVDGTVGLQETTVGEDFSLQPNPASTYVEVVASAFAKTQVLLVQDALGRTLQQVDQPAARTMLQTADLAAGVYMVTLRYQDGSATTKRLIVE